MPVILDPSALPTQPTVIDGGPGSPTLAGYNDANPCPRVEVAVTVAGAQTVTVWRTTGGQRVKVRGADNVLATDVFFIVDYEVPLARDVQYTASIDGGAEGPASTAYIPSDTAWLQDPLSPSQSAPLRTTSGDGAVISSRALTSLTYAMPTSLVQVLGATYPVALGGTRSQAQRIPFDLFCNVAEATSKIASILNTAFPVLLRPLPVMDPLPPVCFMSIPQVDRQPVTTFIGGTLTRWSLTADLVAGPAISVIVPVWSYADVSALWATYGDATATGRTYLDFLRNPQP